MEYAEIFNGLFCNIAASSIMLPVQEKVKYYFTNSTSPGESGLDESPAIPLAIGYYFNMLDKIEDLLKGDNLVLTEHNFIEGHDLVDDIGSKVSGEDRTRFLQQLSTLKISKPELIGRFSYSQINLKIIYPKELSNRNLRDCSFFLNEQTRRAT